MAGSTTNYGLTKPAVGEAYDVNIFNNNADIIDTQIKNRENWAKMERMLLFANAGFAWGGSLAAWDAGALTVDAGAGAASQMSSPQPAFAVAGSVSGSLKFIEPGIYAALWVVGPSAHPGLSGYQIAAHGTWPGTPSVPQKIFGETEKGTGSPYWETAVVAPMIRVPTANLEIRFIGMQTTGTTNTANIRLIQLGKL